LILEPLSDQVQELDEQMAQMLVRLKRTDGNVAHVQDSLDGNVLDTVKLREDLGKTNSNLTKARQALTEASERDEMLQHGLELTNAFTQRLHDRLEFCCSAVPELERGMAEFDCQVQAMKANIQRTSDSLAVDVRGIIDQLGSDVQDLKTDQLKTSGSLGQLRSDFSESCEHSKDGRQLLDRTCSDTANLRKSFDDMVSREGQMGGRVNEWKHQWSKLQPKMEALSKESARLKQLMEHHEGTLCTLQQGYATNFGCVEVLENKQVQTTFDLQSLQQNLSGTQLDLSDSREALSRANQAANATQIALQKTDNEMRRTSLKLDALETKHFTLCDVFEKTSGSVADLSKDHRRSISNMDNLKHELEKTNETLSSARTQLEATDSSLHGLKGEFGRASEVVQGLDHGVKLCQATFAGLQKGFVETGVHAARRPSMLPKLGSLGQEGDLKRPDSATDSTMSSRNSSRRSSLNADEIISRNQ